MTLAQSSTLRPGLLVSLKTSVSGNVKYNKTDLEADHKTATGERRARWETERTVADAEEYEAARKARGRAQAIIRSLCSQTAFGLLCPQANIEELEAATREARKVVAEFNAGSRITKVGVYIITGRVAADDAEAVRAINSEVDELIGRMQAGIEALDPTAIREAAGKLRDVGQMLSPDAQAKAQIAIENARNVAKAIKKAGETASAEIDKRALRAIAESRTAFLDLDDQGAIAAPAAKARALDFEPEAEQPKTIKARASKRAAAEI